MKVLLLSGYRQTDALECGLGLARDDEGETLLDRRILSLREMGLEVITVVSGAKADEQLRGSRLMQDTDLVFDNTPTVTLISNAREGALTLPNEACFVHPVEIPVAPEEVWTFLLHQYAKIGFNTPQEVLQAGAPWHFGFPLLFTRQGCEKLQNTEDLTGLVDARLSYLHLAPEAKPL